MSVLSIPRGVFPFLHISMRIKPLEQGHVSSSEMEPVSLLVEVRKHIKKKQHRHTHQKLFDYCAS